jgi:hypothetical protein
MLKIPISQLQFKSCVSTNSKLMGTPLCDLLLVHVPESIFYKTVSKISKNNMGLITFNGSASVRWLCLLVRIAIGFKVAIEYCMCIPYIGTNVFQ